jgi:CSLREA domain-containing protein
LANFNINITVVPAADITVNTVSDELNADGDCSLREAITSANSDSASDACAIGDGADSIGFGVAGTIVLNSALPAITSDVAIVGPAGDKVIIDGGGAAPLFVVASGGILRLDALTLSGGFASVGGAIMNPLGGTLTVFNSTWQSGAAERRRHPQSRRRDHREQHLYEECRRRKRWSACRLRRGGQYDPDQLHCRREQRRSRRRDRHRAARCGDASQYAHCHERRRQLS